ncbi:helix-turn-helix transcriptional regulator [Nisaea acidiphila]|uniref:Helix-turn-helix transcriptional regulator n=1 Tax=Nisaea acidiphila TaxID=1862145 RepID=A0A9J7AM38_9PROT|nr:helix-turn-helix transcriptional regulator [Nisaea acidiphila]UUX48707.1 helix-turn-helix transcriptional regulator [Nisaea acidiphila]
MKDREKGGGPLGGTYGLAALIVMQSLCAVFFIADAVEDIRTEPLNWHDGFEAVVALALIIGVVFGAREMRRVLDRAGRAEAAVSAASGALGEMIAGHFDRWQLTDAERDVALLAIKGFEISEIAGLRNTAPSTVRAQLTRVYAKAGVAGRSQLVSLFIDDLLGGPLAGLDMPEAERLDRNAS